MYYIVNFTGNPRVGKTVCSKHQVNSRFVLALYSGNCATSEQANQAQVTHHIYYGLSFALSLIGYCIPSP